MSARAAWERHKARFFAAHKDLIVDTFGRARPGSLLHSLNRGFSRAAVGAVPHVIKLDVTNRCTLHCAMCYAAHGRETLSLEQAASFLSAFRGLGMRLDLMGGEPLLHPGLEDIVRFARKDAGFGEVILYTNGTLATPERAGALKEAGLGRAIVNLNAATAREQDSFTGLKGSWKKAMEGMKNFSAAGIRTYVFFVMHAGNIGSFEKLRSFAEGLPMVRPLFYSYIPSRGLDAMVPDRDSWQAVKRRVLYGGGESHRRTISRINAFCGRACLGGYYSFSVKVTGEVTPCPFIDDVVIGNAFEEDFWEVFARRRDVPSFRSFLSVPQGCEGCAYLAVCRGGCRAGNRDASGCYSLRDHRCPGPWRERFDAEEMFDRMPIFF